MTQHAELKPLKRLKKNVKWQDLTRLKRSEIITEILLPLPWLLTSLLAAAHQWYVCAVALSFVFFLTGLRQNHNANHYAIGVSKPQHEWIMFVLSVLMLGSMHVVQINHLRHHKYFPDKQDVEAISANRPAWFALLIGPIFPILLTLKAFQVANRRQLGWIIAELLANGAWIFLVFSAFDVTALKYHVVVMALGQCLTAFFAVWTVHHDCDPNTELGRTIRHPWLAKLTFNMFYHQEHHLFPAVPTCHLPILAQRLDRACPELPKKSVFALK